MVVLAVFMMASLGLGVVAGGDVRRLAALQIKGEAVLLCAMAFQVALPLLRLHGLYARLAYAVWFATFPVIALVCAVNRRVPGMLTAATGLAMNGAAIGLNGGMPVSEVAARAAAPGIPFVMRTGDFAHVVLGEFTRLPILADVLPMPGPVGMRSVASVGDVVLTCGVAAVVLSAMLGRQALSSRVAGRALQDS
jgi:hypothetical protein